MRRWLRRTPARRLSLRRNLLPTRRRISLHRSQMDFFNSLLELPRMERRLPRHVLNVREVETVLSVPDLATPIGVRDRALLETLYSTGIRRMELINLTLTATDANPGPLMVRQGKGKKDRRITVGTRRMGWTG